MSRKTTSLIKTIAGIIVVLILIIAAIAKFRTTDNTEEVKEPEITSTEVPDQLEVQRCEQARAEQLIEHVGYRVSYNPDWRTPNWVAYELTKSETYGELDRYDHFDPDPDVKGASATFQDYSHSGYDRGHMAPAGDMKWDQTAMEESFYLSNICPQDHNLNKGVWNTLEEQTRYWARKFGSVYVVCGPIMSSNPKTIGRNKVAVPDGFYKVLLSKINGQWQAIGFYFDNKPGEQPLRTYCKSVDEIEQMTGIDFFPALDDATENSIESSYSTSAWGLR